MSSIAAEDTSLRGRSAREERPALRWAEGQSGDRSAGAFARASARNGRSDTDRGGARCVLAHRLSVGRGARTGPGGIWERFGPAHRPGRYL